MGFLLEIKITEPKNDRPAGYSFLPVIDLFLYHNHVIYLNQTVTKWCIEHLGYVPWNIKIRGDRWLHRWVDIQFNADHDAILFKLRWL